jgi:ribonuclease HII
MAIVVGIDEVGRGCWAGPLVAAAVVLPEETIPGLADSKLLSRLVRERLAVEINKKALAIGVGWVEPAAIDSGGITHAVKLAMQQALLAVEVPYDEVIIDGSYNFLPEEPTTRAVVKADGTIAAVSAASIIAKVARDNYMSEQALQYPQYGFDRHVGYGTAFHLEQLQRYGVTPLHRKSYKPIKLLLSSETR